MNEIYIIDSHSHLDDKQYRNDLESVMDRMDQNNVIGAIVVGIDIPRSKKCIALAQQYGNLCATVGVHPHTTNRCNKHTIPELRKLAQNPEVVAIGEIGLDFNRMFSPQNIQEQYFLAQMKLAEELDLPMVFHERDSNGRFLELLQKYLKPGQTGVVHCFGGNKTELMGYLDLGLKIGITGIATQGKRGESIRSLIPLIPDDSILIETDCPYLTPEPYKREHRRNEPGFLNPVLKTVAKMKGRDVAEMGEIILNNTLEFFRIDL